MDDEMRGSGMVTFGAIMICLVGAFNVLDGIVAVAKTDYFSSDVLVSDVQTWGWIFIVWGTIQFFIGAALFGGSRLAQTLALIVTGLNLVAQLAYLSSYPAWSIAIMVADVAVIYAISAHGTVFAQDFADDDWSHPTASPSEIRAAAGPRIG
jgi:hypothetical protein